jgi:GT2 family glycosyltransferase
MNDAGLVGSVTVDITGEINFPYTYATAIDKPAIFASAKSVSFCCTVLSNRMLEKFDFNELPQNMDWFDVFISRKSRQLGFCNYVVKNLPVVHKPHSSRPWKNLKYKNPILYYLKKIINHRDRI